MFIYIAHAEADKADAEDLQTFLKKRGLVVNLEDGSRGFHHLQQSDVVVALWSQKSVFSTHRLQMEKRMLDAWADERLVLVKLDHGFLPVGMRDLSFIDASFANGRELAVWPQVERAAREAINRALAERAAPAPSPVGGASDSFGSGISGPGAPAPQAAGSRAEKKSRASGQDDQAKSARDIEDLIEIEQSTDYENSPAPSRWRDMAEEVDGTLRARARRSMGASIFLGLMVLIVLAGGGAFIALRQPTFEMTVIIGAVMALAALVFVVWLITGRSRHDAARTAIRRKVARKAAKAAAPAQREQAEAPAAAPAPAPPAAEPTPAALFISYSHADNAAVEPVVRAVQENGRVVWIDKTGIQTGDGWAGEIVRAIKSAKGIMVMCSKHAFESDHVKREVYLADRYKKPLSPVFIEDAKPPEDFEYFFASVQWLELWKLPEAERRAAIGKALEAV
ncbi:MAG TPA: toll/interleukin-1 receptor domain-containing protein [Hyphomonadaceae bacterium]|jgi:hypothetical protein|nr:toll/interleukin-1 receptor domain-containing protein [Hyphomonadaceae bacterium]